jgi:ankyrin repeat protein
MKSSFLFVLIAQMLVFGCGKQEPAVRIWDAAAQGNIEAISQYLDAGGDINETFVLPGTPGSGGTPLHIAVLTDQMEVARLLLEKGANINAKAVDEAGGTPLYWAAEIGRLDIAKMLVEAGADVNAIANNGLTPLDAAIYLRPELEKEKEAKREIAYFLGLHGGKMSMGICDDV